MGFNLRNRVDECLANCVDVYLANCVVDLPLERLTMSVSLNSLALALTWASVRVGFDNSLPNAMGKPKFVRIQFGRDGCGQVSAC